MLHCGIARRACSCSRGDPSAGSPCASLPVGYIQTLARIAWQGGAGYCGVLKIGLTKYGLQLGHSLLRELGGCGLSIVHARDEAE